MINWYWKSILSRIRVLSYLITAAWLIPSYSYADGWFNYGIGHASWKSRAAKNCIEFLDRADKDYYDPKFKNSCNAAVKVGFCAVLKHSDGRIYDSCSHLQRESIFQNELIVPGKTVRAILPKPIDKNTLIGDDPKIVFGACTMITSHKFLYLFETTGEATVADVKPICVEVSDIGGDSLPKSYKCVDYKHCSGDRLPSVGRDYSRKNWPYGAVPEK